MDHYQDVQFSTVCCITDLEFWVDLLVFREDLTNFQAAFEGVDEYALVIDIEVNTIRTSMLVAPGSHVNRALHVNDQTLGVALDLKYLGSTNLSNRQAADNIKKHTNAVRLNLFQLRRIFW